jgi:hypothetical protein
MAGAVSRRGFVVAGAALALAGCATRPVLVAAPAEEAWPELEPLLAVEAGPTGLMVRVASKGCAARGDFVFRVDRQRGKAVVAFARRRLETCRVGEAGSADLSFSYEELGLKRSERFVVANPLLTRATGEVDRRR